MTEQAQGQPVPEAPATQEAPADERTFTQADLKKIAANEKREGKQSAISELLEKSGAESIDDVLSVYEAHKLTQAEMESAADREQKAREKAEAKAQAAEERYLNTRKEFALRDALRDRDVPSDRLADALALAKRDQLEVDKDGNVSGLDEVVEELLEPRPWLLEGGQERPRVDAPQTNNGARLTTTTPEDVHAKSLANLLFGP